MYTRRLSDCRLVFWTSRGRGYTCYVAVQYMYFYTRGVSLTLIERRFKRICTYYIIAHLVGARVNCFRREKCDDTRKNKNTVATKNNVNSACTNTSCVNPRKLVAIFKYFYPIIKLHVATHWYTWYIRRGLHSVGFRKNNPPVSVVYGLNEKTKFRCQRLHLRAHDSVSLCMQHEDIIVIVLYIMYV